MLSIYQQALGSDFQRLHPEIQRRFGLTSAAGVASIGRGVMERLWHGPVWTLPFLYMGSWRRIMFPESGRDVPFTVSNYAFVDPLGRETVTWVREFTTRRRRRFDAYMVYCARRGCVVDYLGSHEHLAVDLELAVDERGGLRLRSGAQRLYEGMIGFSFPLLFSGVAEVHEWYEEAERRFHIEVCVANRVWGPLFGYSGSFEVEWRAVAPGSVPAELLPLRYEGRE